MSYFAIDIHKSLYAVAHRITRSGSIIVETFSPTLMEKQDVAIANRTARDRLQLNYW